MIIDFDKIEKKTLTDFKGGQGNTIAKMHTDELGKIMLGRLEPGAFIGLHTHETSSEIIYIISGEANYIFDDKTETARAGQCHYCPKGHAHSMINKGTEEVVFLAVVPEQ